MKAFDDLPEPRVMSSEQRIARANQARRLMEDELFNEIVQKSASLLVAESIRGIDVESREAARLKLIGIETLREGFMEVVNDGAIAAAGAAKSTRD